MDLQEQKAIMKPLGVYTIEQCYAIVLPYGSTYWFWQPWVIGYSGETCCGVMFSLLGWVQYCWIDQELKFEMTGKR